MKMTLATSPHAPMLYAASRVKPKLRITALLAVLAAAVGGAVAIAQEEPPPDPATETTANVEVRVWQNVRDARSIYISARPEDGSWATLGTMPLPLDDGHSSNGRFRYGDITVAVPVASAMKDIEVRVWQNVNNARSIYISARPEGGSWATLGTIPLPLDDGHSSSGRFRYGDITVRVAVSLPRQAPRIDRHSIIGDDARRRVADTTQFPYRAIAYLELYDRQGERAGHCTGTFVGPDAVLTAAHCLWNSDDGWMGSVRVVPGKDGAKEPFGSEWAEGWWVPDAWIDEGEPPFRDWGIIALPTSTLGERVGWMQIAVLSSATLATSDFQPGVVGYHGDVVPPRSLWGHFADSFSSVQDLALFYEIDTIGGSSGSAIFSGNNASPFYGKIVGVHAYGLSIDENQGLNFGRRVNRDVLDDLLTGCRELGCTVDQEAEDDARPAPTATPVPTVTASLPATPTGLRTSKIDIPFAPDDVRVNWNPVRGAAWYEVWHAPVDGSWEFRDRVTMPTYRDTNPIFLGPDRYTVRACNNAGCSAYSTAVTQD